MADKFVGSRQAETAKTRTGEMPLKLPGAENIIELLHNIPGGIAIFSESNGVVHLEYTNPGFYTLHHGSEEYWADQSDNPVDWLPEMDRHLFEEELAAVKSGAQKEGSVTYRIVGEDGNLYWVIINSDRHINWKEYNITMHLLWIWTSKRLQNKKF